MRNKMRGALLAAALCAGLWGCAGDTSSVNSADMGIADSGRTIELENDGVDERAAALLLDYFDALQKRDYEAYRETVYPPLLTQTDAYYQAQGSDGQTAFERRARQFDEDGYESWGFTKLSVSYYDGDADIDGFLKNYVDAGMFKQEFADSVKADAREFSDVVFSLDALYEGDEEAVTVVDEREMILLENEEGIYVFD